MNYKEIKTKRCNELIERINNRLSDGMLFDIMAAKKRIQEIDKAIDVISKYVVHNSWFLDLQDVIENQNLMARLRGEKEALAKIIADHKKRYNEVEE